ncbi:hypothetical protein ADU59_12430 [Pararhizobium polonicum]|uniref:Uncharacterized protein n=1 Tax=Pararhizobium polonicum TaxID=1612624 RepID=A0A1C7P2M2_9HYPH|nr:hypothetical protein [Pararhizobium polonicum]OBZ95505.1 hypothetical protein ADU59_12430 [Pararhizobium polonicum]
MIAVVEGISAAGKTTWCRTHAPECIVPETFPPDRHHQSSTGLPTAQYWTDWNAKRWADALSVEAGRGVAVCDTDPLKLHYLWSLVQIGEAPKAQWLLQLETTRAAFAARRLGFADLYLVKKIDAAVARLQSDGDTKRLRDKFDLHVRLQEPLIAWYQSLDRVLPECVLWHLPDMLPSRKDGDRRNRYDLEAFDTLILSLPAF